MIPTYLPLLAAGHSVFGHTHTLLLFRQLIDARLLCNTRRTLTGVLAFIPGAERRVHDADHQFFQCTRWEPDALFDLLTRRLVREIAVVLPGCQLRVCVDGFLCAVGQTTPAGYSTHKSATSRDGTDGLPRWNLGGFIKDDEIEQWMFGIKILCNRKRS